MLSRHISDSSVVGSVTGVLSLFSKSDACAFMDTIPLLLTALARYPGDNDIAACVSRMFAQAADERPGSCAVIAGGTVILLEALRRHAADIYIATNAVAIFSCLLREDAAYSCAFVAACGTSYLLGILTHFSTGNDDDDASAAVVLIAVRLLRDLVRSVCADDCIAFIANEGFPPLLAAVERFSSCTTHHIATQFASHVWTVVEHVCGAKADYCAAFVDAGGVPFLLAAFPNSDSDTAWDVAKVLAYVTRASDDECAAIAAGGGLLLRLQEIQRLHIAHDDPELAAVLAEVVQRLPAVAAPPAAPADWSDSEGDDSSSGSSSPNSM